MPGDYSFQSMSTCTQGYRLSAATGIHRGDRAYQQDQVQIMAHPRVPGCAMGVLADGMGGKSGGRKAADQVILTAQQIFDRYAPSRDDPREALKQLVLEAHLMIKLTAITSEEEPHSTVAAFIISPSRECDMIHAGDSRVYHFRGSEMLSRTVDHSFVQRLVDEGQLTEEEANVHPQSNLLTGCLGTHSDPPIAVGHLALAFRDLLVDPLRQRLIVHDHVNYREHGRQVAAPQHGHHERREQTGRHVHTLGQSKLQNTTKWTHAASGGDSKRPKLAGRTL